MDNKVLDEAVEVALSVRPFDAETLTVAEYLVGFDEEDREQLMRAALLAALPVLLGPVVAWEVRVMHGPHGPDAGKWSQWQSCEEEDYAAVLRGEGYYEYLTAEARALYAPDLGGGK